MSFTCPKHSSFHVLQSFDPANWCHYPNIERGFRREKHSIDLRKGKLFIEWDTEVMILISWSKVFSGLMKLFNDASIALRVFMQDVTCR